MIHVFKTCFNYEAVNPYKDIYDSTEEYMNSNEKFELINLDNDFITLFPKRQNTCFSGGIMGICDYSMSLINGWDERFRGRGWEDYAFTSKIELFLYSINTYSYSALHLWHPYEINTTRIINEALNLEYETYSFYNYLNLINIYINFGSPIKYACLKSTNVNNSFNYKKYISDNRYYYSKNYFNKIFKQYKNNKNVYLYLCDQLEQLTDNTKIKESGLLI
jgi:predicted glycosyltransferase involved in capsule biosynthesis